MSNTYAEKIQNKIRHKHEQSHDFSEKEHVKILSINGGGVKGIIPALILQRLEEESGKKIQDLFDYIVGTSVGGILALALSMIDKNTGEFRYNASDLPDIAKKSVKEVFPENYVSQAGLEIEKYNSFGQIGSFLTSLGDNWNFFKRLFTSPYSRDGIDKVLSDYLQDAMFNETGLPVSVFSYCENTRGPRIWSSLDKNNTFYLKDGGGATCSAPTILPPKMTVDKKCLSECHKDNPLDSWKVFGSKCESMCTTFDIDAGIYVNNPVMLGYSILASNNHHLSRHNVTILSLGTGQVRFLKDDPQPVDGMLGAILRENNIITKMMEGSQLAADLSAQLKFHNKYIVMNPYIDKKNSRLDNSRDQNMEELEQTTKQFLDHTRISKAIKKLASCLKKEVLDNINPDCDSAAKILEHSDDVNYWYSQQQMEKLYASKTFDIIYE